MLDKINNFCILFAVIFQTTKSTDCLKFIFKIYGPWISCKYRTSRPKEFLEEAVLKILEWSLFLVNFRANMLTSLKLNMFKGYADYFRKIFRRAIVCRRRLDGHSTKNIPFNFQYYPTTHLFKCSSTHVVKRKLIIFPHSTRPQKCYDGLALSYRNQAIGGLPSRSIDWFPYVVKRPL